ncbi:Phage head-tail joining protein [Roseovarius albus]|uniref:Phage head-tail joining protein n=1 Tax=Roseovarius albus TaxID=1247867 RepID=A0A1X6ZB95_9RHOB|nr:head-tail adaptor protein [Roseovarius albus]SLN46126.1 Phage head-tail joining protein [Roseovarius albus]
MKRVHLNRKLVLEAPERVADGAGGYSESWAAVGTLWADVSARSGREVGGTATNLTQSGFRIVVRAAPVGTPARPVAGQRFRDGTRVFAIEAVYERDVHGRFLTCHVQEEGGL